MHLKNRIHDLRKKKERKKTIDILNCDDSEKKQQHAI